MKYATFIASFKLILKKDNKILVLTERNGLLDFPGGRIEKNEKEKPIKDIIKREIKEELGENVKYKLLGPAVQYRRYNGVAKMYTLITAYEAEYLSGRIKLSDEHVKYEWIKTKGGSIEKKKFFNKEEQAAIKSYLKKF